MHETGPQGFHQFGEDSDGPAILVIYYETGKIEGQ